MNNLLDKIEAIKEKVSDKEYMDIMNELKNAHKKLSEETPDKPVFKFPLLYQNKLKKYGKIYFKVKYKDITYRVQMEDVHYESKMDIMNVVCGIGRSYAIPTSRNYL